MRLIRQCAITASGNCTFRALEPWHASGLMAKNQLVILVERVQKEFKKELNFISCP